MRNLEWESLLSLSQARLAPTGFFDSLSYRWPPAGVFEFDLLGLS